MQCNHLRRQNHCETLLAKFGAQLSQNRESAEIGLDPSRLQRDDINRKEDRIGESGVGNEGEPEQRERGSRPSCENRCLPQNRRRIDETRHSNRIESNPPPPSLPRPLTYPLLPPLSSTRSNGIRSYVRAVAVDCSVECETVTRATSKQHPREARDKGLLTVRMRTLD